MEIEPFTTIHDGSRKTWNDGNEVARDNAVTYRATVVSPSGHIKDVVVSSRGGGDTICQMNAATGEPMITPRYRDKGWRFYFDYFAKPEDWQYLVRWRMLQDRRAQGIRGQRDANGKAIGMPEKFFHPDVAKLRSQHRNGQRIEDLAAIADEPIKVEEIKPKAPIAPAKAPRGTL